MATKLEIPAITFTYLLQELNGLENSLVTKVQELKNNWIRLRLLTKAGQKDLVFCSNAFFISQYSLHARQQSSGFGGFLNKHLKMKKLLAIKQLNSERVFFFDFGSVTLVAELFSKGNLILLDSENKIMMPKRVEHWSTREIKKGLAYKEPPAIPDITKLSVETFYNYMNCDKKIVPLLVKAFGISPVLAEEACFLAGINRDAQANALGKHTLGELFRILTGFYSNIATKNKTVVLIEHNKNLYLLPFRLTTFKDSVVHEFKTVNEALNELFVSEKFTRKSSTASNKILELQHALQKQKDAIKQCECSARVLKKKAEWMYEHFADVNSAFEFAREQFEQKRGQDVVMYNMRFGSVTLVSINFKNSQSKNRIFG